MPPARHRSSARRRVTVTDSLTVASTASVSLRARSRRRSGSAGRRGHRQAPRSTSIGSGGAIGHRNRPSRSVLTEPRWPTMRDLGAGDRRCHCARRRARPSIGGAVSGHAKRETASEHAQRWTSARLAYVTTMPRVTQSHRRCAYLVTVRASGGTTDDMNGRKHLLKRRELLQLGHRRRLRRWVAGLRCPSRPSDSNPGSGQGPQPPQPPAPTPSPTRGR